MPEIQDLLGKRKKPGSFSGAEVDEKLLNKLVSKMKRKMEIADEQFRKSPEAEKLRKMVEEKPRFELKKASPLDLRKSKNSGHRTLAGIYALIRFPFGILTKIFHTALGERLNSSLEAADMNINANQYLAITVTAMFLTTLLTAAAVIPLYLFLGLDPVMSFLLILTFPFLIFAYMLVIPGNKATKRANEIEKQLPFALRHMSIEVKAGVTLFKTMKSIAHSNYGLVSEGFQKVLSDIDKGLTTEDALEKWVRKAQVEGLRRAISHIVRALRTGGDLSQIMVTIADDVTFERRARIGEYVSKLNLLSLFLMMTVIVLPVMLTILTAIGSSNVVKQFAGMFSIFSPTLLAIIYFVMTPMFLAIFITIVKSSDPG